MIVLNKIIKNFNKKPVLNNIDMNIYNNEIIGLIGKNGAGKTTLIKMISGLIKPDSGYVKSKHGTTISCLLDDGGIIPELSAYENLKLKALRLNISNYEIKKVMNLLDINEYGNKKVKDFSLGMRRRTAIAVCLINKPKLLLLDEPINGLDPQGIKDVRNIIEEIHKESGISILISSHNLDQLAKVATRYIFMNQGKIIENINKNDLNKKLNNKLIIKVDAKSIKQAKLVMNKYFSSCSKFIEEYNDGIAYSIDKNLNNNVILTLIKNKIPITEIFNDDTTLEEYFLRIVEED